MHYIYKYIYQTLILLLIIFIYLRIILKCERIILHYKHRYALLSDLINTYLLNLYLVIWKHT